MLPDVDVDTTDAHEGASFITVLAVIAVGAVILLDKFFGMGITAHLMSDASRWRTIVTALVFIAVCGYGKSTSHRSFMHSIAALLVLTILMGILLPSAAFGFSVGYASHLAIDLFNHKGEQLLFPARWRFCLDLCDSDGIVNHLLGIAGTVACIYLVGRFML